MRVRFGVDRFPIVLVSFPSEGDDDDIRAWYDEVEGFLDRAEPCVAFVDDLRSLEFGKTTAAQRRLAATRHERLTKAFADKHAGNARIVAGPIAIAILRVFDWLSPAPWPVATFRSEDDAFAWCEAQIAKHVERVRSKSG